MGPRLVADDTKLPLEKVSQHVASLLKSLPPWHRKIVKLSTLLPSPHWNPAGLSLEGKPLVSTPCFMISLWLAWHGRQPGPWLHDSGLIPKELIVELQWHSWGSQIWRLSYREMLVCRRLQSSRHQLWRMAPHWVNFCCKIQRLSRNMGDSVGQISAVTQLWSCYTGWCSVSFERAGGGEEWTLVGHRVSWFHIE